MTTQATFETIIEEVARRMVNHGLFGAIFGYCVYNGVMPHDLTDNEVMAIISDEVRRRCPGVEQLNEAE